MATDPTVEHMIPGSSITQQADRIVEDVRYQGRFNATVANQIATEEIGAVSTGSIIRTDVQGTVRTGLRVQVNEGGIYELVESISHILKREIWNIEWQEISKDIRTWLTTEKGGMSATEAHKALAHIANWEQQKDNQRWDLFDNFKYDDGTEGSAGVSLTGSALVVAQKIMKGVQTYSIWAPVVTRTTTWLFMPPASGNLGKIETPVSREGWSSFNGATMDFSGLATKWLKNVERSSSNSDGTFTLTEGWLGADDIDGDLYDAVPSS